MNSLVNVLPYSKLNFQGEIFFTKNWCKITLNIIKSIKAAFGHYVMNATDIGHSDASQNYKKMGTEFILPLLFDENIDILHCKNSQGSFN